jgi:CheY-like chemotaxis protein
MTSPDPLTRPGTAAGDRRPVFCPACSRRYELRTEHLEDAGLKFLCLNCETVFRPRLNGEVSRPPDQGAQAERPLVVVAHESPAVCTTVGRVLEEAGFATRFVHDGDHAVASFDEALPLHPSALVLDVGIPGLLAFQVCSILKSRPRAHPVKVVLLASVFERTRYKRRPTTLHGADAYVELHHVPDRLVTLLRETLASQPAARHRAHLPRERAQADALRDEVMDLDAARTLARRLVSDVALYHESELRSGLDAGKPLADAVVSAALAEARSMFARKVGPAALAGGADPFGDAVQELLFGLARGRDPGASP